MTIKEELIEALEKCSVLFSEIRSDWTDPRDACREGWGVADAAAALGQECHGDCCKECFKKGMECERKGSKGA